MQCCKGQAYDRMFDAKTAAKQLRAYEKRGATGATASLLAGVQRALGGQRSGGFSHLDIGGGVGVLQHELAAGGATQTTAVDASRPYLELLRQAAAARGYEARQTRVEGDFTEVAGQLDAATVVTLDKVLCCYPDMPALVRASASKATEVYGITVPIDAALARRGLGVFNWFVHNVLRWQFQAFIHAHSEIDALCSELGLRLVETTPGLSFWSVRVYRRAGLGHHSPQLR